MKGTAGSEERMKRILKKMLKRIFFRKGVHKHEIDDELYTEYIVKRGDTLWGIAKKYLGSGTRYKEIMYASGITSENEKIYPNQRLLIPKVWEFERYNTYYERDQF